MTSNIPPTPALSEKHSGIPARLAEKAQNAKSLIFDIATKQPRKRQALAVPEGIEEPAFLKAIDELAQQLGKTNVELANQPLNDGWYMERS